MMVWLQKKIKLQLESEHLIFSQSVSLTQYVVLSACPSVCLSVPVSLLSKRPSSYCLIHFGGTLGAARGQKTTFDGRHLWWRTTFDGRQPLKEDNLWWKVTFDGRWHWTEDNLGRKTTLDGRQPLTEDDLWRKTTFDGRRSQGDTLNTATVWPFFHPIWHFFTNFYIFLFKSPTKQLSKLLTL